MNITLRSTQHQRIDWMKAQLIPLVLIAVLTFSIAWFANGTQGEVPPKLYSKVKAATGPLRNRTYRKLGIAVSLPTDTLDVTAWGQSWYRKERGMRNLDFLLAKVEAKPRYGIEDGTLCSGYINVFTAEEFAAWKASGHENRA